MNVQSIRPYEGRPVRGVNTVIRSDGREIHIDDIATAADGEAILAELVEAIITMEDQIDMAETGEHPRDPEWHRRVNVALKRKRYQRQPLQHRISVLRKAEKAVRPPTDDAASPEDGQRKAFVIAAADMLDHELVTEIWARARELRPSVFTQGGA